MSSEKILLSGLIFFAFAAFYLNHYAVDFSSYEFRLILNLPDAHSGHLLDLINRGSFVTVYSSFIAAIVSIIILDLCNRQLLLGLIGFLSAAVTAILPLNTNYTLFLFLSGLRGLAQPFQAIIPSVWIIDLTRDGNYRISYQILEILQFASYFGSSFFVNALMKSNSTLSFVDDVLERPSYQKSLFNLSTLTTIGNDLKQDLKAGIDLDDLFSGHKRSPLWKPFSALAGTILLSSILLLIGYFVKPYKKPSPGDQKPDDKEGPTYEKFKKDMPNWYSNLFTAMICLVLFSLKFFEQVSFSQIYYLAYYKSKYVNSVTVFFWIFFASYLAGKVLNLFSKFSIQSTLFINFIATISGLILLNVTLNFHVYAIYASQLVIGLGMSSMQSMVICLVEERVTVTNKKMSIFFFLTSLAEYLLFYFYRINLQRLHPSNFVDNSLIVLSFAFLIYFAIVVIDTLRFVNQSLAGLPKIDPTDKADKCLEIEEKKEDKIEIAETNETVETVQKVETAENIDNIDNKV